MVTSRGPRALPKGAMSQRDVVRYWGRDRADYRRDANRKNDLSKFVAGQCR